MKRANGSENYVVYAAKGKHWHLICQTRNKDVALSKIDKNFLEVPEIIGLCLNGTKLEPFLPDNEMQTILKDARIKVFYPKQPGDIKYRLRIIDGCVLGLPKRHIAVLAGRFGETKDSEHFLFYMPENGLVTRDLRFACGRFDELKNGHKIRRITRFQKDGTMIIKLQDGAFYIPGDGSSPTFGEKPVYLYRGPYHR